MKTFLVVVDVGLNGVAKGSLGGMSGVALVLSGKKETSRQS